ncbi:TraB family protein [Candidatus Nanohalococcus occultus]|uniref:TraB family protein n=1 Tax=Candidatus Nanohalococcus occultus TaxID=2978047 RepID=UPI0039DF63D9
MRKKVALENREIEIVGTSHVAEGSIQEVEKAIAEVQPDFVGVELDQDRYNALKGDSGWKDLDVADAVKNGKGFLLLFRLILSIFQRKAGNSMPGKEMLKAAELAEDRDIDLELIDQDINTTFQRARDKLTVKEKLKLAASLVIGSESIEGQDLLEDDIINKLVEELGEEYPSLAETFLYERNSYMANKILEKDFNKAVVVVGAAHVEGLMDEMKAEVRTTYTDPENFPWFKIATYAIPAFILAGLGYSFWKIGMGAGAKATGVWIGLNGTLAALGAIIARSHPLTWLVAFIAAPLTSLDPALGAGMVAAYAEAKLYPPTVGELEDLSKATEYGQLWENQAGRVLLTFVIVSIGSAAATFLSAGYIASVIF